MMNHVLLVGKLANNPTLEKIEDEKEIAKILIELQNEYRDLNGEYKTSYIPVIATGIPSMNVVELCKKGDAIAIRGKLQMSANNEIQVIAEKVTFIPRKEKSDE